MLGYVALCSILLIRFRYDYEVKVGGSVNVEGLSIKYNFGAVN